MADGSLIFDTAVDTKGFNTGTKQISTSASKLKGTFKGLGGAAVGASKAIGVGIAGATAVGATAIVGFGAKGVQLASDLSEVQNVVDTTFGDGAKKINDWAKKAGDSFGLSELQAKKMTGTLGAMTKSMGLAPKDVEKMSTSLTGLSGDFASFYNISSDDAFEKIRSGISGETEPLKQLGINMSVANLESYALSTGMKKQYKNMTQAEQAQLRYGYLMKVSADAQGDFSKTSGSFANQQRILKMRFDSLSAEIGKVLLPIMTDLTTAMSDLFKDESFTNGIKAIFNNVAALAKQAMPILLNAFKTFLPMMMQFSSQIMPVILNLISKLIPYIMPFVQKIIPLIQQSLTSMIPLLLQMAQTIIPIIFNLIQQLMPQIMAIAQQIMPMLIDMFNQIAPLILDLITNILPIIIQLIQTLLPPIIQIITAVLPVLISLIDALLPIVSSILELVKPLLDLIIAILQPILDIVLMALTPLIAIIAKLISLAIVPLTGYINALKKVFGDVFATIADNVAERIAAIKEIFSGLINFITGVFSGDWEKAWTGIKDIFGGIWDMLVAVVKLPINLIIDMINGLVNGVVSAFNGIINAVNGLSFKVPDWVPKIGGEDFGFDLTQVTAPQIPKLATGTVVPANYGNFTATLGDAKVPEVISPLPTMVDAVMQALEMWGGGNGDMVLRVEGNGNNPLTQLARALLPYLTVEKRRKGGKVVG